MHVDANRSDSLAVERRKGVRANRNSVGGMIGACPCGLDPRDVCKIGKFARWFERGDERRKAVAIGCEDGRTRWLLCHEDPRHRGEEFFAHDFLHGRKAALERLPKAGHHIVAVDGEAARGNRRIVGHDAARDRLAGIQQSIRK